MQNIMKKTAATAVMGGALLFTGGMGLASAAPPVFQEGLVNVAIGDVTILQNVDVGVAAQVVAQVCDLADLNAAVLGTALQDGSETSCTIEPVGAVTVTQVAGGPPGQGTPPGQGGTPPGQQGR